MCTLQLPNTFILQTVQKKEKKKKEREQEFLWSIGHTGPPSSSPTRRSLSIDRSTAQNILCVSQIEAELLL